jgi:hypothetical protein
MIPRPLAVPRRSDGLVCPVGPRPRPRAPRRARTGPAGAGKGAIYLAGAGWESAALLASIHAPPFLTIVLR